MARGRILDIKPEGIHQRTPFIVGSQREMEAAGRRAGKMSEQPTEFSAVVTDIRLESREGGTVRWRMTLDHTLFTPGDTGVLEAVSRTGTRIEVPVLAVIDDSRRHLAHRRKTPRRRHRRHGRVSRS